MLVRFLAVRVAVLAAVCVTVSLLVSSLGIMSAFGILVGAFTALYRIRMYGSFLEVLINAENIGKKPLAFQIFSQLILFGVLIASILADFHLFIGVTAGLLLVPLYICINALTEKTGITHNSWGIKD